MKTLVVFESKHGTTREIARKLAEAIGGGSAAFELGSRQRPPIEDYEAVVLGGPVYAGSWSRRAAAFARENLGALKAKPFAAFSSGYGVGEGPKLLKGALPPELSASALGLVDLGGAFVLARMNAFERFIVKKVSKVETDVSNVDDAAIAALASAIGSR
jgi:menaquinone-dependent protoporphyrinogen oxidase